MDSSFQSFAWALILYVSSNLKTIVLYKGCSESNGTTIMSPCNHSFMCFSLFGPQDSQYNIWTLPVLKLEDTFRVEIWQMSVFLILSCSMCKLLMNISSRTNYKGQSENSQSYRSSSRNLETARYKTLLASGRNLYLQTG